MTDRSRREFLKRAGLAGLTCSSVLIGGSTLFGEAALTTSLLEVTQHTLPILPLESPFDGYKIGFLTDPHLGPFVPDIWITRALFELQRHNIDCLLLGGDNLLVPESRLSKLFWEQRNPLFPKRKRLVMCLDALNHFSGLIQPFIPKDGVFSVLGNHEGWHLPRFELKNLKRSGLPYLVNESITITRQGDELTIVGVDDYWTGAPKLSRFREKIKPRETRVLLAHNPDGVFASHRDTNFEAQLSLSGHTHGGQLCLPGGRGLLYNVNYPQLKNGLVKTADGFHYTSRGIGVVEIPHRIQCPQEVNVFTLTVRT